MGEGFEEIHFEFRKLLRWHFPAFEVFQGKIPSGRVISNDIVPLYNTSIWKVLGFVRSGRSRTVREGYEESGRGIFGITIL